MTFTAFKPITRENAADILGVSIRTIDNFIRDGQMPTPATLGLSRRVYWHPEIFYGWLDTILRSQSDKGDTGQIETTAPRVAVSLKTNTVAAPIQRKPEPVRSPSKRKVRDEGPVDSATRRSDAILKKLAFGFPTQPH